MIEVKICGLTQADDVKAALELGADYVGFVLYPKSARGITPLALAQLLDQVDVKGRAVGVFVNEPRAEVLRIAADCALRAVQLHGDERADDFRDFSLPIWRATRIRDGRVTPAPESWLADRLVVDADVEGSYGGTGVLADWSGAADLASEHRVMLGGGLTPDNVADAIHSVHPLGVDTASGVETAPGRKDLARVAQFIERARMADGDAVIDA